MKGDSEVEDEDVARDDTEDVDRSDRKSLGSNTAREVWSMVYWQEVSVDQ